MTQLSGFVWGGHEQQVLWLSDVLDTLYYAGFVRANENTTAKIPQQKDERVHNKYYGFRCIGYYSSMARTAGARARCRGRLGGGCSA